jgi:hypothetical protein
VAFDCRRDAVLSPRETKRLRVQCDRSDRCTVLRPGWELLLIGE